MKIFCVLLLFPFIMLTSCTRSVPESSSADSEPSVTYSVQEFEQLHIGENGTYVPLNYSRQIGMWLPYMTYDQCLKGHSEEEFRSDIRRRFNDAKAQGVNTVYVHIHPNGDAYYRSEIFPKGTAWDGNYDPLAIMLEEAHRLSLSVHGWLNPLRCQTEAQMEQLSDDFIIKKWSAQENGPVKPVNRRLYLDPSHEETVSLLESCVDEILDRYQVDGIHIDDYFYPTAAPDFDRNEFAESGSSDLSRWRLDNCSRFVKAMYERVKSHDKRLLFGISPQGSIQGCYESQFADVKLWCSQNGYCDYIVPQIYFGFRNESCPFEATLECWMSMVTADVALVIGLAGYKQGKEDKWAGASGADEWVDDPNVIEKQIALIDALGNIGYAVYY